MKNRTCFAADILHFCLTALVCLTLSGAARAADLFVDASYTGGGSDGSAAKPFTTIQAGGVAAHPGDVVNVQDGTYNEFVWLIGGKYDKTLPNSGYLTYRAVHKGGAKIRSTTYSCFHFWGGHVLDSGDPSVWKQNDPISGKPLAICAYVIIDGFDLSSTSDQGQGIDFNWVHHATVRNCTIHDCPKSGIGIGMCDYLTFENNVVHDCSWGGPVGIYTSGISLWKLRPWDTAAGIHNTVRGNLVYHNYNNQSDPKRSDGNGIIIDSTAFDRGTLVENNVVFNNGGGGILVDGGRNCIVRSNTLYQNGWDPNLHSPQLYLVTVFWEKGQENTPCVNNQVYDNIIVPRPAQNGLAVKPDSINCTLSNNLRQDSLPTDFSGRNDVLADPLFVNASTDPATANFHLQGGSPAIRRAAAGRGPSRDFDGVVRPARTSGDIGAFMYVPAVARKAAIPTRKGI